MNNANVLRVDGLTKSFGRRTVVDDISFRVRWDDVFGFLGIIRPNHGSVEVLGSLPERRGLKSVGYLPEERGLTKKVRAKRP